MLNRIIYISTLLIIVLVIGNCNIQQKKVNNVNCSTILKNQNITLDNSIGVDDYVNKITTLISKSKNKENKELYKDCSKAKVVKFFLEKHNLIDSITITPSEHGVTYFRKDEKVWGNIIIVE